MDADAARLPLAPEPLTPPPLSRAWWRRFETPYMTVSLLMVAAAAVLAARRPWGADFWVHATAVDRLSRDLLDPGGLQIAGGSTESSYYSPYTVVVALLTQFTGTSAVTALSLMAPVMVALLCFGFYRFTRLFHDGVWFPVLALAAALSLWGVEMWAWGGFVSVYSLPVTLPLPSTLATALMFLVWTMLARALRDPRAWRWAGLGSLATLIVLVHQLTAFNTAIGCAAIVIWRWRELDSRVVPGVLACVGSCVVVALSWPYYSVVSLLGSGSLDGPHAELYTQLWRYQGLILLALPALWLRLRRDRRDVFGWMFLLAAVVLAVGWPTGRYTSARVLPLLMLAGQLALVIEIYRIRGTIQWQRLRTRLWAAATVASCLGAFLLNSGNVLYLLPPSQTLDGIQAQVNRNPIPPDYGWLSDFTDTGDVVVTDDATVDRLVTAHGVYTLAPGWRDPAVPETDERIALAQRFFATASIAERTDIVAAYDLGWVIDMPGGPEYDPVGGDSALVAVGPDGQRLYRLRG